ncbi:hypothetical protein PENSPDRAFT_752914 [Peniophora sp. CONT]|nr:hypothetical protein PENSPDRAFT_752914 [Peniophora sp. CONT]
MAPRSSVRLALAEPVVFVRGADFSDDGPGTLSSEPPSLLRGILVLDLTTPTRITSIEVELRAKTKINLPPTSGAGHRVEPVASDERTLFLLSHQLFKAASATSAPPLRSQRALSVNSGLPLYDELDFAHSPVLESSLSWTPALASTSTGESPLAARGRQRLRRQMSTDSWTLLPSDPVPVVLPPAPVPLESSYETEFAPSSSRRNEVEVATESRSASSPSTRPASYTEDSPTPLFGSTLVSREGEHRLASTSTNTSEEGRVPPARSQSQMAAAASTPGASISPQRGRQARTPSRLGAAANFLLGAVKQRVHASGSEAPRPDGIDGGVDLGWTEFKKGVYTFPISLAIPADAHPSLAVEYGRVSWKLKAHVHRPGALTARLSAVHDVTVVALPSEDDTEETGNILVERFWSDQLHYIFFVSGKIFPVGGVIPLELRLLPMAKIRIAHIVMSIEEHIEYECSSWQSAKRTLRPVRAPVLSLKPEQKTDRLLPLESDDPNAFASSPLAQLQHSGDASETLASFVGPGPWTLVADLQVPSTMSPSNRNGAGGIRVTHTLKVTLRVERGDNQEISERTGERKLFDIIVKIPISLLSSLADRGSTVLPRYAAAEGSSHARPSHRLEQHSSPAERLTTQLTYERLVAGQESEIGEAPPGYSSSPAGTAHEVVAHGHPLA